MLTYVLRRLLAVPLLLVGVATVAFCLSHFTQADPLTSLVSDRQMNNPEVVAAAKRRWGLDQSLPEQYTIYIRNLVTGDLGVSFRTRRPVLTDIVERLPATLELVIAAMTFGTLSGVLLGVLAARFREGPLDYVARLFALIGSTIPVFWSGLLLLYIFSVKLSLIPGPGRIDPRVAPPEFITGMYTFDTLLKGDLNGFVSALHHLVLPAFVLGWSVTGIVTRLVRGSMLDVLGQDYILAARAKGAGEGRTLFRHALAERHDPHLDDPRLLVCLSDHRRRIDGIGIRLAGHRVLCRRFRPHARLSRHHRRLACGRDGFPAVKPCDRHRLCVCEPANQDWGERVAFSTFAIPAHRLPRLRPALVIGASILFSGSRSRSR